MRKLEYNNQQFRNAAGFSYQSLETTIWEDESDETYRRSSMQMQHSRNGMRGGHCEDRFPLPGRFSIYMK